MATLVPDHWDAIRNHSVPVKLGLKSKAGFLETFQAQLQMTERETEKQGGSGGDSEVGMEPHKDQQNRCTMHNCIIHT